MRKGKIKKLNNGGTAVLDYPFQDHLSALGLPDIESYQDWCARHDFTDALHKSEERRKRELQAAQREQAEAALAKARNLRRKPEDFIEAVFAGEIRVPELRNEAERDLYGVWSALDRRKASRPVLLRLLRCFGCDLRILTDCPAIGSLGWQPGNTYLHALARVAERPGDWIRSPESWKPEFGNARRRFGSLVRHLLAPYAVPAFLDAAWFENDGNEMRAHLGWFVHIGSGQNIRTRTADMPVALTKRAAHLFLKAPVDLSIVGALRWAQVTSLGGSARLVRAILGTRLGEIQADEPFWATVLHFFVNHDSMLDPAQIGPMIDYIHFQKFVPDEVIDLQGNLLRLGPRAPEFSMKGRTPGALLRLVEEWHRALAKEKRPARTWARSGISEYRVRSEEDRAEVLWTIQELLSAQDLHQEGRYMNNCVATYVTSCARGECSIWSLRRRSDSNTQLIRVATIEINNRSRSIVQARGRFNRTPECLNADGPLQAAPEILRLWAASARLELSASAW